MDSKASEIRADTGTRGDPHVRIRNLRKTFGNGSIVACNDISIDVGKEELFVLLGPSGCGKTTILRSIAGLEQPDSGTIHVGNEDVTLRKPKDRDIAFVFQHVALFPHKSVRGNMQFGLDMKTDLSAEEKRDRVEEAAAILGIEELLDRKPAELSGGQKQRVSLGRAMVMEPEVFLLDEPFSALDANLRDAMRVEIKKLQRTLQTSMIFVTHDQQEALTLGDKIVVVKEGDVQQVATPYEIFNEPANEFVAQFIGSPSVNSFECVVRATDDGTRLENDLFEFDLTESQRQQFTGSDGDTVTLTIRPDFVTLNGDDPLLTAEVTVIEPSGSRDAVYLSVNDTEVRAVTPQGRVKEDSSSVDIGFERERIWIFDEAGGRIL